MHAGRLELLARAWAAAGLAAGALLALAWIDVLPGGWRLRGVVEAHAAREARERVQHLADRCRTFASADPAQLRGGVLFLGSSTIERCPLAQVFPSARTVNRGVGGARGAELAAHLDGLLRGVEPEAVVLYAGGPDRVAAPLDVAGALAGAEALARGVAARCAGRPVLLLGLLPTTASTPAELEALARIDAGLGRLADELGFAHVSLRDSDLAAADGRLREDLSTDGLHLTEEGYAIFARRLRAAPEPFASLLGP
ncbi:MAG: hypothetical protein JNK02_10835 [Planctomycetes bacterium]|nr:hypothetical protein [Planctomycetota bacterium]